MTSTDLTARLITAGRYIELLRRYRAKPLSFTRQKTAFYSAYWASAAQRVGADVADLGGGLLRIARGAKATHVRYHHVDLDSYFNKFLVDDKIFVSRLVRELGFRSPRFVEYTLPAFASAQAFLDGAERPCVVKPIGESSGRGITTGISTRRRLIRASQVASASFALPTLMLEEQHAGECYRLLYLDGQLLHAVKRGRPTLVGDGRSSIRELVGAENRRRQTDAVLQSICALTLDLEMEYTLAAQGLRLHSIPAADQVVTVKNVSNQNSRRDQAAVSAEVHGDYHELAARVTRQLGTHLIGLDVISPDISAPPAESESAILEINIPPGLHYHELVPGSGAFSDVGELLLGYLLARPGALSAVTAAGASSTGMRAQEKQLQRIVA